MERPTPALRDIVEWDVRSWSKAIAFWEAQHVLDGAPLDCLEIGARGGGLTLWMAQRGHRVLCSDLTESEGRARPLLERYGITSGVSYQDIDATDIPYDDRFDVIVFKSVLGGIGSNDAIEKQRKAVASIHRALKPGGKLLFAENLAGSPLHLFLRRRFVRWGDRWRYPTLDEMRSFLAPFRSVSYGTTGFLGTFGRSEQQRALLAAMDDVALNRVVPEEWRYIVYGVATK
jgi:SAM-dependent methyltransferase